MSTPAGRLHRVVGIETEYGVTSSYLGPEAHEGMPLSVEDAVQELFRGAESVPSGTHRFTTSGARLYVDIGLHPEFAGPECLWVSDVVAQDLAGDARLHAMAQAANERLAPRGARVHVLKSNVDGWGATFGCHENYQVERGFRLPLGGLIGLLAARQVLAGAGALPAPDQNPAAGPIGPLRYSARAEHIRTAASDDPTHERAFVNTRDEPHADAGRWRRLHVVAADSAISPWTTALKVVLLDAALTVAERGLWDLAECELVNPAAAARAWSLDPLTPCARPERGPVTCPQLLEAALDRLGVLAPAHDALSTRVMDLARRGTQALRTGDIATVSTELDWAIKYVVLARVAERAPLGWADPRVRRAELAYHDLSPVTGLREPLTTAGLLTPLVGAEEVQAACERAPDGTRAALRGRVVEACNRTRRLASIGWAHVRLDCPPSPQIDLLDPQAADSPPVEALLERIEELGPWEGGPGC
ncbi:proteasome accessory factor PafA2 family protein [Actinomyces sp.]|uniref:proteasome accessory factor PafA2 family protein n=1 Tax=Actinomyces sp. TaxID=29317 RepID=UPI0026DA974E|nr:proteasome accessory factor PafA2 family protein [Actinomyces sp.]MDO4901509.1 proteasome accessory factor PafA2 family protein [Actinomyces sp.]